MLVNIIQNTISSFRSALAAAEVITTNLKMWLGFETSETGYHSEMVTNGNFAIDSDWSRGTGWTISNDKAKVNATSTTDLSQPIGTVLNGTYKIEFKVSDYVSGSVQVTLGYGGSVVGSATVDDDGVYEAIVTTNPISTNQVYISTRTAITQLSIDYITVKELTQITPDKSGNNNVGELFTGKALDFNGSTDYVNTTGFEMAGTSATFAFWIYPKDTAYQFVMDLDGTVRSILGLFNGGSGQVFAFFNSGFKQFGTPIQNQWQRVVFRVSATTVECYVNGVKSGSTLALTSSIDLSTVGNSVIGGRFDTTNTSNRFDGSLSDFQIYNAYWSTDDIAFDYANPNILVTDSTNTGTSIAVTNLKAYWAMSEGAGSLVYDSSGEANNGTINGATYAPAQPTIPQLGMQNWAKSTPVANEITLIPNPNNTSQDILGNAVRDRLNSFNLDGSGYAEVADDTDLDFGTGAFTMECWVVANYVDKGDTINVILSLGGNMTSLGTAGLNIKGSTGKIRALVNSQVQNSDNQLTFGQWYHVVSTRNSVGLCELYIDAQVQSQTDVTTGTVSNTNSKFIGKDTDIDRSYEDLISDVRLYGRALSATEVENNYNAGLSAHTN